MNEPAGTRGRQLVFGASGYIGRHLVPYLVDHGYPVRAVARRPRFVVARGWHGAEIGAADAQRPETLPAALEGVSVAYYLVHSMAAGRGFGSLDEQAAANFRDAAAGAGVRRIVYLGGLVPAEARSEHLRSRASTGEILRAGPVPVTEIRAGIIVGPGSAAFEAMRDIVLHFPLVPIPRAARNRTTPIALENLLAYLVHAPEHPESAGAIYDAGGPEDVTYEQMMRAIPALLGRRVPPTFVLPGVPPTLFALGFPLVTSVPAPIARALTEGMTHDFTTDDTRLHALVPQHLLGLEESIRAVFAAERSEPTHHRWIEGAFAMRAGRHDYAYYPKRASGSHHTRASPAQVWAILRQIGGENRYFYLNSLWTLREVLDWMAGGPGLERGRPVSVEPKAGDRIDSWRVIGSEPERRLTLEFGMKAPGSGVLEFELEPLENGSTRLTATAYWQPAGVWGLLYWYPLSPFHKVIFEGMTREICERAERA